MYLLNIFVAAAQNFKNYISILTIVNHARRQDSVTGWGGGAEINFGGARKVYLSEFERGSGAPKIYSSVDQTNIVKTKKKMSSSQKCYEIRCESTKITKLRAVTPIWESQASICTPIAPSLLISLGHSPRLGGTSSHLGGHGPGMPPRGAGPVVNWLLTTFK